VPFHFCEQSLQALLKVGIGIFDAGAVGLGHDALLGVGAAMVLIGPQ
jgi:hypothetical protein